MTKRDSYSGILSKLMAEKREQYVAFVDLLGFGSRVVQDWAEAARAYDGFVSAAADLRRNSHRGRSMPKTLPQVQFWSDAAVIIGDDLPAVAEACQDIQTGAVLAGVLVNLPLYYLVYASKSERGDKIWQSITKNKPSGQRGLF